MSIVMDNKKMGQVMDDHKMDQSPLPIPFLVFVLCLCPVFLVVFVAGAVLETERDTYDAQHPDPTRLSPTYAIITVVLVIIACILVVSGSFVVSYFLLNRIIRSWKIMVNEQKKMDGGLMDEQKLNRSCCCCITRKQIYKTAGFALCVKVVFVLIKGVLLVRSMYKDKATHSSLGNWVLLGLVLFVLIIYFIFMIGSYQKINRSLKIWAPSASEVKESSLSEEP